MSGIAPTVQATALRCQSCSGARLHPVLDLGRHPPSDAFIRLEDAAQPDAMYPLQVFFCEGCLLVQLGHAVDPAALFGQNFIYRSGMTNALKTHLQAVARALVPALHLTSQDLAVDIGSNDGTLLEGYRPAGIRLLGVEPSSTVAAIARAQQIPTVEAFFTHDIAERIVREHGPARIITATNVFAHVRDLAAFMAGIDTLLAPDGIFLTESHYLLDLVQQMQYDEIYLEHLRYYSLTSMIALLNAFHMDVVHAERVSTHGGSLQVWAARAGAMPRRPTVEALLAMERRARLNELDTLTAFRGRVETTRRRLQGILVGAKEHGERIVGIGAPAKGNTLLNYCGITTRQVDYLVEKNELKIGRLAPGSRIPIVPESRLFDEQPDYALLLSWNIKEELMPKLRGLGYRGRFIIPNPEPMVDG